MGTRSGRLDARSLGIKLPLFAGGLLVQKLFQFLSRALSFALGSDVQEADLELDLGEVVHNPLYRTYERPSIGVRYSFIQENALQPESPLRAQGTLVGEESGVFLEGKGGEKI